MTYIEIIACLLIIGSVLLIGLGSAKKEKVITEGSDSEMENSEYNYFLAMAILFGLLNGIKQTFNAQNVNWIIKTLHFPAAQMTFEGGFLKGLFLVPFFVWHYFYSEEVFEMRYVILANISIICGTLALFTFSEANKYGKGAAIQAIYNTKVPIQTLLVISIDGLVPTPMQIVGLVTAMFGVSLFVLKKTPAK